MVITNHVDPSKPPPNGHVHTDSGCSPNSPYPTTTTTTTITTSTPLTTPLPPPSPPPPPPPPPPPRTGHSNPAYVNDDDDNHHHHHHHPHHNAYGDDDDDYGGITGRFRAEDETSTTTTSTRSKLTSSYYNYYPASLRSWSPPPRDFRHGGFRSKSEVLLSASRLLESDRTEGVGVVGAGMGWAGSPAGLLPKTGAAGPDGATWGTKRSWLAYAASKGQPNTNCNNGNDNDHLTADEMVVVERPILTEFDFDQGFEMAQMPRRTPLTWVKKKAKKCVCSCACVRGFLLQVFPFLRLLRGYSMRRDLPADVVAGLTVGIMHIPQGMAYGQLSTLPPVYGLYVSFFPVILYFFLGTSKHISMGTFAVVSLMVGSVVDKGLAAKGIVPTTWNSTVLVNGTLTQQLTDNSQEVLEAKLAFAMAVTFAVGCVQLLLGIFRLGFLTVYLSDPLVSGFTTGAACHVFTSQVKHIFGLEMGRYSGPFKLVYSYRDLFLNLPHANAVTLIASLVCIVLLVFIKEYINNNPKVKAKLKMPVPVELIVVVLGTVISYFVKLEETYDVQIVGDVPVGIPAPKVQQFTYLSDVVSDAIAIGIVAFAISVSMAKILAKKHDYDIDPNQELLAYGTMNVTCSFFSSFCAAASLSRSLVQDNVGCRTQVTGMVSSALLLVVLLVLGSYFRTLPNCVLAAIIVVALKGMFKQFAELKRLWGISIIDFMVWLTAFGATVLLDVDLGLMVGILFALLTVIIRNQRPHVCVLGQVPCTDLYKDMGVFKAAKELRHIKIFRFDSALFFANSEYFKTSVFKMTADPRVLKKLKKKADKQLLQIRVSEPVGLKDKEEPQNFDENNKEKPALPDDPEDKPVTTTTTEMSILSTGVTTRGPTADTASEAVGGSRRSSRTSGGTRPNDLTIALPTVTDVYFIVIDCTAMSYVDSVGVKVLQQVITEMRSFSIQVFLAHCKAAVREMFEKTDFYRTSDKECLFLTVHDAVLYARRLMAIVQGEDRDRGSSGGSKRSSQGIGEHGSSPAGSSEEATLPPSRDDDEDTLVNSVPDFENTRL